MAKTEQTIWSSGHTARRTQLPASKNYKKLCFVKILKQIFIARRRQRLEKVKLARLGKCRHMFVSAAMLTPICSWHRLLTILDISRVGQIGHQQSGQIGISFIGWRLTHFGRYRSSFLSTKMLQTKTFPSFAFAKVFLVNRVSFLCDEE